MSEMLAKQYFLARNFDKALIELRRVLERDPQNTKCQKKLIICHTQLGQIEQALATFLRVLKKDPFIIIDTHPEDNDCPCPELVIQWEQTTPMATERAKYWNILGMLYLYCDLKKSIAYFQKSLQQQMEQEKIRTILNILQPLNITHRGRKSHATPE